MDRLVGLGEYIVTGNPDDTIKTFALASCVGITAYSPLRKIAGMTHIVLPACPDSPDVHTPCYYADRGVPLFIDRLCAAGCTIGELRFKLFGGADSMRKDDIFNIGARNLEAVERILREKRVDYQKAEVGGTISRTLTMNAGTGEVSVRSLRISYNETGVIVFG